MSENYHDLKRVCVIGLDGLEHDLVEKFDLKAIKQREYGKIDISMFKFLATPFIWASFITGLPPQKHGLSLTGLAKWKNPVIETLRKLSIKTGLDKIRGKAEILKALGFRTHTWTNEIMIQKFRSQGLKTLFDLIPNSKALSVPPYQQWRPHETGPLMKEALENQEKMDAFEEHVWNVFERKKEKCLEIIERNRWNLFMVHFSFSDLLGHIYAGNLPKMFEVYVKAENLVEHIKKIVGKETLVLVISDHGMKPFGHMRPGDHSDHGFYSSNVPLNLVNPKITEFFPLIVKIFARNNLAYEVSP